jgi:hypothetical protein
LQIDGAHSSSSRALRSARTLKHLILKIAQDLSAGPVDVRNLGKKLNRNHYRLTSQSADLQTIFFDQQFHCECGKICTWPI